MQDERKTWCLETSQGDVSHVRPRPGGLPVPAGYFIQSGVVINGAHQRSIKSRTSVRCLRRLQCPQDTSAPKPDTDSGHVEECAAERRQTAEQLPPSGACKSPTQPQSFQTFATLLLRNFKCLFFFFLFNCIRKRHKPVSPRK